MRVVTLVKFMVLGGALTASMTSIAHTPYLMPNAFEPINGGLITLDASFAERFFVPEVVFDNSEFEVQLPDGRKQKPETVIALKSRMVVEHDMADDGTYRFSTGRRLGRVFKAYELKGETIALEDPEEAIPEGAKLVSFYQSSTMAETYATRGGTTDTVLAPRGDGIEYQLLGHPNALFVGDTLQMQALFYGAPLAGLDVDIFLASQQFGDESPTVTLVSGAAGELAFTPAVQGVYLLRSRHRAKAPEGMAAPELSHTYTLVIEVFE